MDAGTPFVANVEPTESMQPGQRAFDDPARPAEATAVRCAALRELRLDAASVQFVPMRLGVVAAIALNERWFAARPSGPTAQRGEGIHQGQELHNVVAVGRRQPHDERNAPRVGEKVMFRPLLAAIGRVRSSFFPPRSARTEALSTTARARSSWPRCRSSERRASWSRRHTPARCQPTSRRQHVLPDPHPISFGSICHGRPARNTNRMPVSAARSGTRGRPIAFPRRRRRFGNSGSTRPHSASSMRRWDMRDRLALGHATVPSYRSKYKRHVSYF